ncbi:SacI domain-containing protein [Histoplasma capsulatum]|uniref:SacI domain-containing protein n=1 Tax=Ajellomyces capsulatus TaxID=5037 RepID=A0A8A1MM61_AJECA|nr:SacI domain-containing protein [Histoplasma capsulatum]
MPGLARKLLIFAAVDGLILQPYSSSQRGAPSNPPSALRIEYKTRRIDSAPSSSNSDDACLESHGVIGLLSLSSFSFLISITQRQQVAQILGKPIFAITSVAIIPLSSQAEATKAINQAHAQLASNKDKATQNDIETQSLESDSDLSTGRSSEDIDLEGLDSTDRGIYPPLGSKGRKGSTIAEDVIEKRGRYGRFTSRWFSKHGWAGENSPQNRGFQEIMDPAAEGSIGGRKSGDYVDEILELDDLSPTGQKASSDPQGIATPATGTATCELMPKFLRYAKMMFSSNSFYFSYDYDITRKFGAYDPQMSPVPLHRMADPLYFWNRYLMSPFIESGYHSLVLPLIQGFVGQKEFTVTKSTKSPAAQDATITLVADVDNNVPDVYAENEGEYDKFLLTLISRRSVKRPGLRYLRRGVDDEGNAANSVETEQILSRPSWNPADKIYSLLQVRGSIPLYFSQSPYYFKPIPVLRHSIETNQASFARHFRDLSRRYGEIQAISLLDKHGVEVKIGETYESFVDIYNNRNNADSHKIGFDWFDFHAECRGMKFENIQRLVDSISGTLDRFGSTVIQDNIVMKSQSGIIRTNCMDCLDRTGVAQCAFGQRALEKQLESEGYSIDLRTSTSTQWFNVLWADNGDAISKQYSSTAALKGDYTRTRKRDVRGALNDLGLTLSRYFNNIVNDYFSQACIDYLLGNVTTRVFDEFEMNLPHRPNTLRSLPFEQSVLLLTDAAVYCCRFDWDTDKVTSFERIDLRSITNINYGTYITSTLTDAQMDPNHNVGVVITYQPGATNTLRVNTRSLHSLFDQISQLSPASPESATNNPLTPGPDWDITSLFKTSVSGNSRLPASRILAFKILPQTNIAARNALDNVQVSENDAARALSEEIERTCMRGAPDKNGAADTGGSGRVHKHTMVEEREIISTASAKKRTGYLEHLVFDIKKLVWA